MFAILFHLLVTTYDCDWEYSSMSVSKSKPAFMGFLTTSTIPVMKSIAPTTKKNPATILQHMAFARAKFFIEDIVS